MKCWGTQYFYILDKDGNPVTCEDAIEWAQWFERPESRRVALDHPAPSIRVSTVFLGLDHSFAEGTAPILWETMIFGGPHDGFQRRYSSKEEALEGHKKAVALATNPLSF